MTQRVDRNTLQAAGISEENIQKLEAAWNEFQSTEGQVLHHMPHIVCTGIYNAGKSTLLNALAGHEFFPTGDIPTTKQVAQAEFGGAVYIDTPGLNAQEADDRETQAAYEKADFILFVANAQNGGVNESESVWLKKLKERYSALEQRLVCVLTHCTQVDPEQLPGIRDKVCEDFKKAVGFVPEPVFCVDSVTYQKGIGEDKPRLAEHSGIPELQKHLSERIAGAKETLRQVQADEAETQRCALVEQINDCMDLCEKQKAGLSSQSQRKAVKALLTKAEKKIHKECSSPVTLYGGLSFSGGAKSFEGKDGNSLKRQARDHVHTFAERRVRDAHKALDQMFSKARQDYGTTGVGSEYFKLCDRANRLLEELQLELTQYVASIRKIEEIHLSPDVSDAASELAEIANSGDYWSASRYLDVYENRIEVNRYDGWYEEKGLFGITKKLPKYVIYTHQATSEIDDTISNSFKNQTKRAKACLAYYWDRFQSELSDEIDKRLAQLRSDANAGIADGEKSREEPLYAALKYLAALEKAVAK